MLLSRLPRLLWVMGVAQLGVWGAVAWLAGDFTPGSDPVARPLPAVIALLGTAFLLYLGSLALVWNTRLAQDRSGVVPAMIVGFAVLFRLPLWWSQPIQETDIYRYLWDGRVLQEGVNPYRYSPAQVDAAPGRQTSPADLAGLLKKLEASPSLQQIFARIEHRTVPTIYPPLSEAVFAAAAWLTPVQASVLTQLRVLKGILLVCDLAVLGFVMGLLRNVGQPVSRALAYGWCPLILKEFANSGHMDSVAVCFTTATLWLLTRRRTNAAGAPLPSAARRELLPTDLLAAGTWAAAVLSKLYPLVLAPLLLTLWWRRLRHRAFLPGGVFVVLIAAGYAAIPGNDLPRSGQPTTSGPASSKMSPTDSIGSDFEGLGEFVSRWEMNDLLFSLVYENLRPLPDGQSSAAEPWYVFTPPSLRACCARWLQTVDGKVNAGLGSLNLPFLLSQVLMGLILLGGSSWLAVKRWPGEDGRELLRRAFLTLAWLWYLGATQNPWYWSWALPLVLFASRAWLLVSGFALVYYLRFWFLHHFPESGLVMGLNGRRFFDEYLVWGEHLPVLLLVTASLLWRSRRPRAVFGERGEKHPTAQMTAISWPPRTQKPPSPS